MIRNFKLVYFLGAMLMALMALSSCAKDEDVVSAKEYAVNFVSENTEMGTVTPEGEKKGTEGTIIEATATPVDGYVLEGWYVNNEPVVAGEDITITGDTLKVKLSEATGGKTYTAKFISQYTIVFESSDENLGTVDNPGGTGTFGDPFESTAIAANENCRFVGWYVGKEPVVAGEDITITGNTLMVKLTEETGGKTYTAKFEAFQPAEFSFTIETTAANTKYPLPFVTKGATGDYDLTVDWGDGTEPLTIPEGSPLTSKIEHTYAEAKEYSITITSSKRDYTKAQMPMVSWKDDKLLKTIKTPLLNTKATNFSEVFEGCSSLTSIPKGLFNYNTEVTKFSEVFRGCSSLTSIPEGLFNYNTAVTNFDGTFSICSSLTSIPEGLFKYNTAVTNLFGAFAGCSSLTSILADLFRYNTEATMFGSAFAGCSSLTSIPSELFRYNTEAINFESAFSNCSSLTSIPSELFRYNTAATVFYSAFSNCSSLTTIPEGLFANNTAVITFNSAFSDCSSLTSIPSELFKYNTEATNFSSAFFGCSSLTSIPSELFKYNTEATNFYGVFCICSNIENIPAELFKYNTKVERFERAFLGCESLTSIPAELFKYNTAVTDFSYVFNGCSSLTSIPSELFKDNTEATNFSSAFTDCSSLTSIPSELFRYNTAATKFYSAFLGCESLTSIPSELFRYNTAVTDFSYAFYDCSSLTSIPSELFRYNTAATRFNRAFYGCTRAKVNPNVFCDEATEITTRFNSVTEQINFLEVFKGVGSELSDVSGSTFPALWDYTMPSAGVYSPGCFTGAKASNSGSVPDGWK
ncbi:MAG: InlB B-repeat-containing protein [Phocaeicola sp.]